MAVKRMYTGSGRTESSSPAKGSKTAEDVHTLHRIADSIASDYEDHANTIRHVAKAISMGDSKSGKAGVKEHRTNRGGSGQKKTNAALGG